MRNRSRSSFLRPARLAPAATEGEADHACRAIRGGDLDRIDRGFAL
jgi:hypothetical protein